MQNRRNTSNYLSYVKRAYSAVKKTKTTVADKENKKRNFKK